MGTPFGAQSAWRQLVDLIGRRRAAPTAEAMARLGELRERVPLAVRAASARALEHAEPPVDLVRLLALDEPEVAAPVLRGARLPADDWIALLPALGPRTRAVLRHRRDLDPRVEQALAGFGAADFVLPGDAAAEPAPVQAPQAPYAPSSFVSLAEAARGVPAVSEALRHANVSPGAPTGPFQISELVARIAAYQRQRDAATTDAGEAANARAESFRFETDSAGIVRWVEGVSRAPLIGLSLDLASLPGGSRVDGIAAGAFRRRAAFSHARLVVEGTSDAAGDWRISGTPAFDPVTGRFTGYRGTARRPRADEQAAPAGKVPLPPDSLRQLVHELRTPTNAIAGFAEMIESELLGPVAASYRARATVIRDHARDLLAAIDDLDLAARIEGKALDLRGGQLALRPLLERISGDLAPLAELRGAAVAIDPAMSPLDIAGDERAVERLVGRLMAALVAAGGRGETIGIEARCEDAFVTVRFDRPAALAVEEDDALLAIDAEGDSAGDGAPLLGIGFALRLVRNLAIELGGSLHLGASRLTLRLPAAVTGDMGQASTN